jgi:hypothetical protein
MLKPAIIDPLPVELTQYGSDPDLLRGELLDIITRAIDDHPRSQQVELGPSEIGHTCARRIGYAMLGHPEKPGEPNWKATVGTAVHAWLEEQMLGDNRTRSDQPTRWLTEMTVVVGELGGVPISGHCDLFDRVTGTVVDWKCVGPTQLKRYKSKGPGEQYRRQAHLYGRGWVQRGQAVEHVGVMFLPRDGALRDAYYWHEPYDEQVAIDTLQRAEGIVQATRALGPAALAILPTADAFCSMCPFYKARSTDLSQGCPGDPAGQRTQQPALTLG